MGWNSFSLTNDWEFASFRSFPDRFHQKNDVRRSIPHPSFLQSILHWVNVKHNDNSLKIRLHLNEPPSPTRKRTLRGQEYHQRHTCVIKHVWLSIQQQTTTTTTSTPFIYTKGQKMYNTQWIIPMERVEKKCNQLPKGNWIQVRNRLNIFSSLRLLVT